MRFASTFAVKIRHYAKPQNVTGKRRTTVQTWSFVLSPATAKPDISVLGDVQTWSFVLLFKFSPG
jgi:hypothetical protein